MAELHVEPQAQVAAYHAENPDLQGIGREQLRLSLQPRLTKQPSPPPCNASRSMAKSFSTARSSVSRRMWRASERTIKPPGR